MDIDKRKKIITQAGIIAFAGNLLLCGIKITAGVISGSLAVIGDGIDTSTDVIIACVTLIISRIIARPSDRDHPWGHGRAETTATMLLSMIIFFAGAQLGFTAIKQFFSGEVSPLPDTLAITATVVSVIGKALLAFSQYRLGKKAASPMVLANAQNMRNDIVISLSVLTGLAAARIFGIPILDAVTAAAVSLWVMKNAVKIFMEMNTELMDGNTDSTLYAELFAAIRSVDGTHNPHRARIRKIASRWDIDVDIEVDANLTVREAHEIAEKVEGAVRRCIPDVYDIMVHIEPAGDRKYHSEEQYGLTEKDILFKD